LNNRIRQGWAEFKNCTDSKTDLGRQWFNLNIVMAWKMVNGFDGEDILDFDLAYDTAITDDVIGFLSEEEVDDILSKIECLPENEK
jgi:hypothetical protein